MIITSLRNTTLQHDTLSCRQPECVSATSQQDMAKSLQYLKFVSFACINVNLKYWNANCFTSWNQTLTFRHNNTNLSIQELTLLLSQPFRVGTNNGVQRQGETLPYGGFTKWLQVLRWQSWKVRGHSGLTSIHRQVRMIHKEEFLTSRPHTWTFYQRKTNSQSLESWGAVKETLGGAGENH